MKKKILFLSLIILILNLIWEFSHYSLYIDLTGIPKNFHLVLASLMDVILVSFLLLIVSIKNKNLNWLKKPKRNDYLLFIVIAIPFAFIWELINMGFGRWRYTELMPTIFKVGLSPLFQLTLTGIISLIIFKKTNLTSQHNNIIHPPSFSLV